MYRRAVALGFALWMPSVCLAQSSSAPAAPPGQQDMMKMMYLGAHNQLGILQYCQAQGYVGADVIDLQKRIIAMMPPAQVDGLSAAEDSGRQGTVAFAGSQVSIADAAKSKNTTPEALCKQMGSMLQAQAANLPK